MNGPHERRGWPRVVAVFALVAGAAGVAVAAGAGAAVKEQDRLELQSRVQARIQADARLDTGQRERMEQNLRRCLRLELGEDQIGGLFPDPASGDGVPAEALIALQDRVVESGESGLAADLLADKVREGRMKRAGAPAIERAVERLDQQLRLAEHQLTAAREAGVAPAGDPAAERRLQKGLALDLWRGLEVGDLDRLRARAEERARDRDCSVIDLAAAAETATDLLEVGADRGRAVGFAEEGLQRGLEAAEMRRLGRMAQIAARGGEAPGPVLDTLRQQLRSGATVDAMMQQMLQYGWLGPRDIGGPAGQSPVDNVIDGPGRVGGPLGPGGGGSSDTGRHGGNGGQN